MATWPRTALLACTLVAPIVCADPLDDSEKAQAVPRDATANAATACDPPFARLAQTMAASSEHLRALAAGCADPELARLFYSRAYHAEVVDDLNRLAQLQKGYASNDQRRLESTRIFVGLAEAFAEKAWHGSAGAVRADTIRALTQAYDRTIDDVELTIRGFDLLVGRSLETR
jgi:hypothetical protein